MIDTLSSIIESNGSPLTYVACSKKLPNLVGSITWEDKYITATPTTGCKFNQDAKIAHTLILKSLTEDLETYTHIESSLSRQNNRDDILAIHV